MKRKKLVCPKCGATEGRSGPFANAKNLARHIGHCSKPGLETQAPYSITQLGKGTYLIVLRTGRKEEMYIAQRVKMVLEGTS